MKKVTLIIIMGFLFFNMGCKKFIDVNESPNVPTDVQEKLLLGPIEYNIANNVVAGDAAIYVNHFLQNIALNQPVPNFGTYQLTPNDMNTTWDAIYVGCLQNLAILNTKGEANGNFNYSGIAKVLTALCLGIATDLYGDIPYTQAFMGSENFQPSYDKQEDIYKTIQTLLDNGIADMNKNVGLKPGTEDFYYGGDMAKWKRAAYTLKARYYMHLTKAPGYTASTQADLALTALNNGFSANTDDMKLNYPGGAGTENRWYNHMLPITTVVMSSNIVETLKSRNDPRLTQLIAPAKLDASYTGRVIGTPTTGNLQSYSLLGSFYGSRASSAYVLTYTEALFLKAEATLIKSGAAAAQPIYQDAIRADMTKLGISTASINTYLAARGTLTAANALQRIIEEKSIANFLSLENYNDWRRTGFPVLTKVPNAVSDIPRRFLYPQKELTTNVQVQQTAKTTDRVWWDQ